MRAKPQSTSIVNEFKEGLVKRAIAQISKREFLFKNMNVYSVGQISNLIQEINGQEVMTVASASIRQTDDFDSNPIDNMMSMSDLKLMQEPTNISQDHYSDCKSKTIEDSKGKSHTTKRQDKLIIIDLTEQTNTVREKLTTLTINKEEDVGDNRQIDAFRMMKQRQYEQNMRFLNSEKKKKPQTPINLANQRVMFSYDSKIIKLDRVKQRQNQSISHLTSNLIDTERDIGNKKRQINLMNNKTPTLISNKINLTEKQQRQQKQKQKKYRRNHKANTSIETQTPSSIIKVNPESHKQHEAAISVKQLGIKISIQEKQFCLEKDSPRPRIHRRLTRSEYLKIKSKEQISHIFMNKNVSMIDRIKPESDERSRIQNSKSQKRNHEKEEKKKKLYLSPFRYDSKTEKSKISIHSLQGKAELIKEVKHKPFLFETIQENKSSKGGMSNIDKYNLLYVKFKGNPPPQYSEKIVSQLQSQSKVLKQKRSLMTMYSNKSTIKRENRLIRRQN